MANLKEVRIRIDSVNSTKQITSAMKMVSAAKFRKAQVSILKLRPYAAKLKEILQHLEGNLENTKEFVYCEKRDVRKVLMVVVASNKGLCGAFNANVMKRTVSIIKKRYASINEKGNLDIICIGKKATDFFKKNDYKIKDSYNDVYSDLSFENVAPIVEQLLKYYADGEYDHIEVVYNKYKNAAVQVLSNEQYLPIESIDEMLDGVETGKKSTSSNADYIFEPTKKEIVEEFIPRSLKIVLYQIILESFASEHGARMTAMHMATDNATELLKNLKLTYNKARQASITNEILEIVGGAEALNG